MIDFDLQRELADLADEAQPADLGSRALRTARRIRIRRLLAASAGTLTVVAATTVVYVAVDRQPPRTPVQPAARICTTQPTALPVPGGGQVGGGTLTDPTGRYLVSGNVLWSDGNPQIIPRDDFDPNDVNAHGVVVGIDHADGAWIYRDGALSEPPGVPVAGWIGLIGINSAGDMIGSVGNATRTTALVWPAGNPKAVRTLAGPSALDSSFANAIGDDGIVVGAVNNGTRPGEPQVFTPYVWGPDGKGHPLVEPPGALSGWASAISGDWAIGSVDTGPDQTMVVRWNVRTGQVTSYPGVAGRAAVTGDGDVLVSTGSTVTGGPYLIHDDAPSPLPLPPGARAVEVTATSISRDGHLIAGTFQDSPDHYTPIFWAC